MMRRINTTLKFHPPSLIFRTTIASVHDLTTFASQTEDKETMQYITQLCLHFEKAIVSSSGLKQTPITSFCTYCSFKLYSYSLTFLFFWLNNLYLADGSLFLIPIMDTPSRRTPPFTDIFSGSLIPGIKKFYCITNLNFS